MKRIFLVLLACACFVLLHSCKRCQTCNCSKLGVNYVEQECAKSTDHNDYFRHWKNQIMIENDYDYCECGYD
jgi:hypothetical protein